MIGAKERKGAAALLLMVFLAPLLAAPPTAAAQTPPDTIPSDTIPRDTVPADTVPADTLPELEPLPAEMLAEDTLPPLEKLPEIPRPVPADPGTAIWEWDREELLANRALTLTQLLEQVPGVVALRGGDFGTPRTVSALGSGGGGVRVYRDGVEMVPLEGSVPDLARIGLGSLERVRVVRTGWGLRIELETVRPDDPRPYSLVEAGTGELDTNLFRGAFIHPRALGGNVALSLDRLDTAGRGRQEPGSISAVWLRYSYLHGDRLGLVAELSRSGQDRDTLFTPSEATRTDWTVRGRARLTEGIVADAFWSTSKLETDSTDQAFEPFPFRNESRSQIGARLSGERGPLFGRAALRSFSGEGLPERRLSLEAGASDPDLGGVAAEWSREGWSERDASRTTLRAWTAPFVGASFFGSVDDYVRGVPYLPLRPPEVEEGEDAGAADPVAGPGAFFTEGTSVRFGARLRWRGLELMGARLLEEADGLHPFGLPMDRDGFSLPAGPERRGWETAFRIPLLLDGLALDGSGHLWETEQTPDTVKAPVPEWPYLPRRTWKAALTFHDTFYPTENLEIWADVGVIGRDRMRVPLRATPDEDTPGAAFDPPAAAVVPFYQSWYGRLQIRVVTVRIFITWENLTVREVNQDFPGRRLPPFRTVYGVRWTLRN